VGESVQLDLSDFRSGAESWRLRCPGCGRPLWETWDPRPPTGVPGHYYWCPDCDSESRRRRGLEPLRGLYLVCWDIRRSATDAERKRFYRFLRKTLGEAYPGSRVLDSLLEVSDFNTAFKIYDAASRIGKAKIYQTSRITGTRRG